LTDRAKIFQFVLEAHSQNRLPLYVEVDNIENDYRSIYKMLLREGLTNEIGMSMERYRNTIWFRRLNTGDNLNP
jgi:hypothetical protein